MFSVTDIAASGLAAERLRMEVVANNLANAQSTRTPEGGAYRRQQVVFASAFESAMGHIGGSSDMRGVRVVGVQPDMSDLREVFQPDHPDADQNGIVRFPNVSLPHEMVDLTTASRAYEANLRLLQTYRRLIEDTLSLMRGTG